MNDILERILSSSKAKWILVALLGLSLIGNIVQFSIRPVVWEQIPTAAGEPPVAETGGDAEQPAAATAVKVHVVGAVASPGVYELPATARLNDAVTMAGGITEEGDGEGINLARVVIDGEQIYVPKKGVTPPDHAGGVPAGGAAAYTPPAGGQTGTGAGLVNLNTASATGLMELPGIGEVKAKAIVDYRQKNGPFKTIEEITNVTGIGDKTFETLKNLITIR